MQSLFVYCWTAELVVWFKGTTRNLLQVLWPFFVILDRHQSEASRDRKWCLHQLLGWLNFHGLSTVLKMVCFDITGCVSSAVAQKIVQRFLYFDGLVAAKPHEKR